MTHYEQRLQNDVDGLRHAVGHLAETVEANLRNAVTALLLRDHDLAYRTILKDGPVNRSTEQLDAQCHRFIALHLPSAGHLRLVSAVIRIGIQLERMGDYATTICRQSVQLRTPIEGAFRNELKAMADDTLQMFGQAMQAFRTQDEALARGTMGYADQVDRDFSIAFNMLVSGAGDGMDAQDLFSRLIIIRQLERVSDQAKNLCEQIVFALTGQTKQRRPVRILLLDAHDDGPTQLGCAIGRKFVSGRAVLTSAGRKPSAFVQPDVEAFLEERGMASGATPSGIDWPPEEWNNYDVIVSLDGPVTAFVEQVPFETVALAWSLSGETPEEQYREMRQHIEDLVDTMRGTERPAMP